MKWTLHPAADPRVVPLDELTAVFHARSGETHLLTAPVLALLDRLRTGADRPALARASGLDDGQLSAELEGLAAAGLIVRV